MDLDQAVWVFDTSCKGFAPDQRRAWNTIRAKLVEGQKPSKIGGRKGRTEMKEQSYAVVSQNMSSKWVRYYEWADSVSKKFQGHFLTVKDAIDAIPQSYRIIKVNITDNNGKEIDYTINRDAPTKQ